MPDRIQTEMGKLYGLVVPVLQELWSFHVLVVQGQQRNVQKNVMHVQSCCFVPPFSLPSPS